MVSEEVRNPSKWLVILECFILSGLSEEPETYINPTEQLDCLDIHIIYIFNV